MKKEKCLTKKAQNRLCEIYRKLLDMKYYTLGGIGMPFSIPNNDIAGILHSDEEIKQYIEQIILFDKLINEYEEILVDASNDLRYGCQSEIESCVYRSVEAKRDIFTQVFVKLRNSFINNTEVRRQLSELEDAIRCHAGRALLGTRKPTGILHDWLKCAEEKEDCTNEKIHKLVLDVWEKIKEGKDKEIIGLV